MFSYRFISSLVDFNNVPKGGLVDAIDCETVKDCINAFILQNNINKSYYNFKMICRGRELDYDEEVAQYRFECETCIHIIYRNNDSHDDVIMT